MSMRITLLCILNTCLMASGQILFKMGASGKPIKGFLDLLMLFFSPIVLIALCIYAATTGLWLYILTQAQLSYAYPIQALAFPLVLFVSMILFHEQVTPIKWIGIVVIVVGVFIATKG